jgi:hypothetical protein
LWKMRFVELTRDVARNVLGNNHYDRLRAVLLREKH